MTTSENSKPKSKQRPSILLQKKRNKLFSEMNRGKKFSFLPSHAALFDEYFTTCFERSTVGPQMELNQNPYAVIALGGYGRSEQCVHSDVDLLILFKKKVPKEAENLAKEFIYPLWDIGVQVGYAFRTIKETLALAEKNIEEFTAILDARFITGFSPIFLELMNELMEEIILIKPSKAVKTLVEGSMERHRRFGDSTYLLEPDVKNGQGGLRDYHTMLWLLRIKDRLKSPGDLENSGYLSPNEYRVFKSSLSFIWTVRNHLHFLSGRKYDQLRFDHQITLAEKLKFRKKEGRSPVENFMGSLHGSMEYIKQHHLMFIDEFGKSKRIKASTDEVVKSGVKNVIIKNNMLYFHSISDIEKHPEVLIKIFRESIRLKIPLSAEAKRIISENGHLADKFGTNASIIKDFEHILTAKPIKFNVLNQMLSTGLLSRIIPEFKKLINRIQYNDYHLFPVDKHSLSVVFTIKNFSNLRDDDPDAFYKSVYKSLRNRKILLWAALLHDIGKGVETDDHSATGTEIAEKILKRAGYSKNIIDIILFLIKEHLFLVNIAKRRDINDEETAIFCARKVQNIPRLKMLFLLTVADSMSTGPKAWNNWSAMLLTDLFLKVHKILEEGTFSTKSSERIMEEKKEKVMSSANGTQDKEDLERFYDKLTQRYILNFTPEEIIEHFDLYKTIGDEFFAWKLEGFNNDKHRKITILGKDKPGLISVYAGILALNKIDILDAQTYTWAEKTSVSIFIVNAPQDLTREQEKWDGIKKDMKQAVLHNLPVLTTLKKGEMPDNPKKQITQEPNKVVIDNSTSSFFTIIEVFTYDCPGLLFRITDALFRSGLDIKLAKITTDVEQVVDVFYVSDIDGDKIYDDEKGEEIKQNVLEILP